MNLTQKSLLGAVAVAVVGVGGWLVLGAGDGVHDASLVDFSHNEVETIDENLDDIAAADLLAEAQQAGAGGMREVAGGDAPTADDADRPILVLEGRVVEPGGKPVANAEVSLYMRRSLELLFRDEGFRGRGGPDWRENFRLRKVAKSVTTGEDGRFVFQGPAFRQTTLDVAVVHARYAPTVARREWTAKDGKLEVADIVVEPGGTAFGSVYSSQGAPLEGAEVRWQMAGGRGPGRGPDGGGPGRGGPGRGGRGGPDLERTIEEVVPVATTDARGQFEAPNLPKGPFELRVEAKKYLPGSSARLDMQPAGRVDAGRIVLELGAELRGVVRDQEGNAIAEVDVRATLSRQAMRDAFGNRQGPGQNQPGNGQPDPRQEALRRFGALMGYERRTKTDRNGEFFLDALPATGVRLAATHPKYIDEEVDPVVPGTTSVVEIRMYRRIAVTGVVVDRGSSKPVELYGIRARRTNDQPWADMLGGRGQNGQRGPGRGQDGQRGPGRGRNGQPGQPDAQAGPGGQRGGDRQRPDRGGADPGAQQLDQLRQAAETAAADFESRRQREEAYRKERLGPSGQAPGPTPKPTAHEAGKFVIDGLQPGTYVFDIDAPGYARIAAGPLELERGQTSVAATFQVERGVALAGIVLDQKTGKPVEGARVELFLPPLEQPSPAGAPGIQGLDVMIRGMGRQVMGGRQSSGFRVANARTLADGRFDLGTQRPGTFQLTANAEDYRGFVEPALLLAPGRNLSEKRIDLTTGGRIFGTVRNVSGDNATVRLSGPEGAGRSAQVSPEKPGYEFRGLDPGDYFVQVEREGDFRMRGAMFFAQRTGRKPDVVLAEGADVRFDLDASVSPLATVKGRVFRNGAPGTGLEVRLSAVVDPNAAQSGDIMAMMQRMSGRFLRDGVGDDGSFEIRDIPAGSYTLEIRRGGGGGGGRGGRGMGGWMGGGGPLLMKQDVLLREGATWEQQFELTTASIEFQVSEADSGKPPERASVELVLADEAGTKPPTEWNGLPSYTRLPARNGVARAEDLKPGSYAYAVRSAGYQEMTGRIYVSGAATPEIVRLQKTPPPAPDGKDAPPAGDKKG